MASSAEKAPPAALPPFYAAGVPQQLHKQRPVADGYAPDAAATEYTANPSGNEATHMLIPIPADAAKGFLNSRDRPKCHRRKRFLFITIALLVLYFIHRRRIHHHSFQGYPPEGLIPEYEFEDPVRCATEASTPVYPDNRLITIPGDASKLALTVLGVGVGKIDLQVVDELIGGIEVETHFHLTPGIPLESVWVDYLYDETTGHAEVIVNTLQSLPAGGCSEDFYDAGSITGFNPQPAPEASWPRCVAVASRVRVPRPLANASVPELRLSAQYMSIGARLHAPETDPVVVAGLEAVTRAGSVAVSGPVTIAGAADGQVRITTLYGSVRVADVKVASDVLLSVGTNAGPIGISTDYLVAEAHSGSVTAKNITLAVSGNLQTHSGIVAVKNLSGGFSSFNVSTDSGPIHVSEVSRGGAATSATDVLLAAKSGQININNFDLGSDVTVDAEGANGGVFITNIEVGSALTLSVQSGDISVQELSGAFQSVEASSYSGGVSLAKVDLDKSSPAVLHVKSTFGSAGVDLSGFLGHFEVRANRGSASVTGSELHFQRHTQTEVVGERGGPPTGPHILTVSAGTGRASAKLVGDA
ncbi:hypothetical protein HK405_000409 [Cladochytrium tenue]|nr:hypothetical protein HK405_000409 [Cladochytrium tenue]